MPEHLHNAYIFGDDVIIQGLFIRIRLGKSIARYSAAHLDEGVLQLMFRVQDRGPAFSGFWIFAVATGGTGCLDTFSPNPSYGLDLRHPQGKKNGVASRTEYSAVSIMQR